MDLFPSAAAAGVVDSDDPQAVNAFPRRVMAVLWGAGILLALVQTWLRRYALDNLDAVSYLDIADAWRAGNWDAALNTYWSPGYSWVIAAAFALVDPAPPYEYVALHAINVLLFCVVIASLHFLLREIVRTLPSPARAASFTPSQYVAVAGLLFLWFFLVESGIWRESPDLIPSAATLAAGALILRVRRTRSTAAAGGLGAALAAGYLGKAAMLPVAPVFILCAAAAARASSLRVGLAASVAFAAIAAPWVLALSIATGRPTFGDAGAINYLWYVNRSDNWPRNWPPHWPHWDGVEGRGTPVHPARRLHDRPAVYEFATPFTAATYPMWFAPGYWYEGVRPRVDPVGQLRRLKISASAIIGLLTVVRDDPNAFNPQPALVLLVLVLGFGARRRRWELFWPVLLSALSVLALYAAVRIAPRYVAASMVLLWLMVLAGVRLEARPDARLLLRGAGLAAVIVLMAALLIPVVTHATPAARRLLRGEPDAENLPWHVASLLRDEGLTPGTPVGVVGQPQDASRWARLARVRIVAEVPAADADAFASADAETLKSVVDAFRRSTARAILSDRPPQADPGGWTPVHGTPYWLMWLDR